MKLRQIGWLVICFQALMLVYWVITFFIIPHNFDNDSQRIAVIFIMTFAAYIGLGVAFLSTEQSRWVRFAILMLLIPLVTFVYFLFNGI